MPATAPHSTDPLADFRTVTLDATSVATEVYLDALDAVAAFQRRLVADTPFAPLAIPFEVQARIARTFLSPVEREAAKARDAQPQPEPEAAADDTTTPAGAITAAAKATTRRPRKAAARTTTSRRRSTTAKPTAQTPAPEAPFAGYDDLTAEEVDARLRELPQHELAAVAAYERAHAARSTVLERVERLQEDEPAPGYDGLRAEEAVKLLADADDAALAERVAAYERRHRARTTVLEAADRRREQHQQ